MPLPRPTEVPTSLWALVAANLVPLAGVLALGWDLGEILLLYWAESAIVLAFSLAKLPSAAGLGALVLVPFFLVHAGMFMGVHLVFLVVLFDAWPADGWAGLRRLAPFLAALVASHGYSYWANVRRGGESYARGQDVMAGFYARVVVLHLTILFGGWVVLLLGQPIGALLLLVALKTVADGAAHLRERRRRAAGRGPQAAPTAS